MVHYLLCNNIYKHVSLFWFWLFLIVQLKFIVFSINLLCTYDYVQSKYFGLFLSQYYLLLSFNKVLKHFSTANKMLLSCEEALKHFK